MPKCKVKVHIQNDEINQTTEVDAIFQENKIKYMEDDHTIATFNYQNHTLTRENENLRMNYQFDENKGEIEMKEYHRILPISLKINQIKENNKNIEINFLVEENQFIYGIEEII